jgi:hypothetical protein
MNKRVFTNSIGRVHEDWLSKTLHIPVSKYHGIDLIDDDVGIEVKSRLENYAKNFAVHAYQIESFKEMNSSSLFWAFIIYGLSEPVKSIKDRDRLDDLITSRSAWLLPWDWIKSFPVSHAKTGPYVYVHSNQFPDNQYFSEHSIGNSKLFLPRDSILEEKLNSPEMGKKYEQALAEKDGAF